MGERLRVTLEIGPKDKKVVAVALDWTGLERGAKTGGGRQAPVSRSRLESLIAALLEAACPRWPRRTEIVRFAPARRIIYAQL